MEPRVIAANTVWFLYCAKRTRAWKIAIRDVEKTQAALLLRILSKNAGTAFGREHAFETIGSVEAFQGAVPTQSHEDLLPYIDRIANGAPNALTVEPVHRFGISSGSTRASKLIPYTPSLMTDFQAGIDPWIFHLFKEHPGILRGKAYWSITPVGDRPRYSPGGIPIGFDDERAYFGRLARWALGVVMVTPPELALVQDMEAFRYATLRLLLQEGSLSWISIWNPAFAVLLLDPLERWFDRLVDDIRTGTMSVDLGVSPQIDRTIRKMVRKSQRRAAELIRLRNEKGSTLYEAIWPDLKLISCWAHGNAAAAVKQLRICFPHVVIQPKGLVATEAFVSFPIRGELSALSITSHFFEFEDIDTGTIRLAHQLETGRQYSVLVTTSGGFYRYELNDLVRVLGFEEECPLICFIGRKDKVVDVLGEKLNEQFVAETTQRMIPKLMQPRFWMVAPSRSGPDVAYTLFLQLIDDTADEDSLRRISAEIDQSFRANYHYDYCRRLGQLAQFRLFLIDPDQRPSEVYLKKCASLGQRLGDIKLVALHPYQHWSSEFRGRFIH